MSITPDEANRLFDVGDAKRGPHHKDGAPTVAAGRVATLIQTWLDADITRTTMDLEAATRGGVSDRFIRDVLAGNRVYITLWTLDALLTAMDQQDELHTTFADIYQETA